MTRIRLQFDQPLDKLGDIGEMTGWFGLEFSRNTIILPGKLGIFLTFVLVFDKFTGIICGPSSILNRGLLIMVNQVANRSKYLRTIFFAQDVLKGLTMRTESKISNKEI